MVLACWATSLLFRRGGESLLVRRGRESLVGRVTSNAPPPFHMRSLRTVHLLAPHAVWRRLLSGSLAHYLGHRNLQSTARYTALAPDRFEQFWKD
jgi:hypothetical protein